MPSESEPVAIYASSWLGLNAKAGKSTLASTAPKPLLILDVEGGTKFLDIKGVSWDPNTAAPPEPDGVWDTAVVKVRHFDDIMRAYEWLQSGRHPFKSVVIDSSTEAQQKLIDKVTNRNPAQMQDWGTILRNFMGMLRDFRDLADHPENPLEAIIAVSMSKRGDDGMYHPYAQGQTSTMLPYLFDVLGAMHVQTWTDDAGTPQTIYRLLIGANQIYEVGERVGGRLPAWIDNPNVESILDQIFGPRVETV